MSTDAPTDPQYELTAWVLLATDGLVAPARERIKQEIEAHYADAVARHVAAGETQPAAEAQALDELGDIHVAARGFRKRYLTVKEDVWLREYEGSWGRVATKRRLGLMVYIGVATGLIINVAMLAWWLRPHDLDAFELRLACASAAFCGILYAFVITILLKMYHLMTHHLPGVERQCKLLTLGLVQSRIGLLVSQAGLIIICSQRFFFYPLCLSVGVVLLVALLTPFDRQFRLLRKLRYAQTAGDPSLIA